MDRVVYGAKIQPKPYVRLELTFLPLHWEDRVLPVREVRFWSELNYKCLVDRANANCILAWCTSQVTLLMDRSPRAHACLGTHIASSKACAAYTQKERGGLMTSSSLPNSLRGRNPRVSKFSFHVRL